MSRRRKFLLLALSVTAAAIFVALALNWDRLVTEIRARRMINELAGDQYHLRYAMTPDVDEVCALVVERERIEGALVRGLRNGNGQIRNGCAMVLARSGCVPPAAFPALEAMAAAKYDLWGNCALARAGSRVPARVAAMVSRLEMATTHQSLLKCAKALALLGEDALPALTAVKGAIARSWAWDKVALIDCIGRMGPKAAEAVPLLIELIANIDKDSTCAHAAMRSLGRIGLPGAKAAVPLLEKIAGRQAQADLADAVYAKAALVRMGAPNSERYVDELIAHIDLRADEIAEPLELAGPRAAAAVPEILSRLENRFWANPPDRAPQAGASLARALGEMGEAASASLPTLRRLAADGQEWSHTRAAALESIEQITGKRR